jgi:AcrR family transcriptional regulator
MPLLALQPRPLLRLRATQETSRPLERVSTLPKTRSDADRDTKVEEILLAAERQLTSGGYSALSLAAIARELGIAQNTIYWYFSSRDELLVASLQRMLERTLKGKPKKEDVGPVESVVWVTNRLEVFYRLKAAISEKALRSQVVADFVEQVNDTLRTMLGKVLRKYIDESDVELAVDTFAATVEGAFARSLNAAERKRLFSFALQRLIG